MKLERNRAERRSKRGVPILYKGIPYLIFAALAVGFLLGAPQLIAVASISQAAKSTVSVVERRHFPFAFAGYLGKTNSILSRGFTEDDFTYTGDCLWVDDGDHNWQLKFLTSGSFTPNKDLQIDICCVGGGAGGRNPLSTYVGGPGGGGGFVNSWYGYALVKGNSYPIIIGAGGAINWGGGGTSSGFGKSSSGGSDANGGSGGGAPNNTSTHHAGYTGGSNGATAYGTGQGTTTRAFGESTGYRYGGGGGGGGGQYSDGYGGAGGLDSGANGGGWNTVGANALANTGGGGGGGGAYNKNGGHGGSGIVIIRNAR